MIARWSRTEGNSSKPTQLAQKQDGSRC